MAPSSAFLFSLLFSLAMTHANGQANPSTDDQQVLQLVNDYRTQKVGIPALTTNDAAACVGQQIAHRFVGTPCTNQTGADTPYGQSLDFGDFPDMVAACGVDLASTEKGYIAVDCIPGSVAPTDSPSVAAQNLTQSQLYQEKLNDTAFTSAGVGSEGVWYALVLARSSPDGNYASTNGAIPRERTQKPAIFCVLATLLVALYWSGL